MEQAEIARLTQEFDQEVRRRFPDAPIERVEVLQYGDDPEIEPGQLLDVALDPNNVFVFDAGGRLVAAPGHA